MRGMNLRLARVLRICLGSAVLLLAVGARGETFPMATSVPHSIPEPLRPKLQKLARQHADALYTHLLLRTDEAERVCGLPKTDVARLELAAKGAVQHAIDDWLSSIAVTYASDPNGATAQLLTMRINGHLGSQLFPELRRGGAELRKLQNNPRINVIQKDGRVFILQKGNLRIEGQIVIAGEVAGAIFGRGDAAEQPAKPRKELPLNLDPADVAESGVWRTTLDRVLTEQDRVKLMVLRTGRESFGRESQLEQMLTFIDEELLLDTKQRDRITELCADFLRSRSSSLNGAALARIAMKSFPAEEMAELLSDRQRMRIRELAEQKPASINPYRPNVVPEEFRSRPRPRLREGAGR